MKSLHVLQNENEAYYEVGTFLLYVASSFMFLLLFTEYN